MMDAREKYELWLEKLPADDPLREELLAIREDEEAIKERFHSDLSFGTAGLRGRLGAGTNCMNRLTVGKATQGIADFIAGFGQEAKERGVIIAHDPRHFSREFSCLAAAILAANGIKAYVFPDLRPTPELAFLVRKMHTQAGINITASHNPKDYNGYKAYWEDGCQVSAEIADGMYERIKQVDAFTGIRQMPFEEAIRQGLITVLGEAEDEAYLKKVESLAIHTGEELDLSIPLVYTPLNGAGAIPFARMLKDRGFTGWHVVEEQQAPDPEFTTVGYPNPESPATFALSEELGRKVGAELLMATDPDSDRFAIEIRDAEGNYIPLNGNQTGYLLVNYILEGRKSAGILPEKGAMVKSIVTSNLSTIMAAAYGVKMFESLTGFKNICGRIPQLQEQGYTYLFGYEESVGYAACEEIRDKDGISAGMLVAEAAAYYRKQGKTLWDVLQEIYTRYGYVAEEEPNLVLDGLAGAARIQRMMRSLREALPTEMAGIPVASVIDYEKGHGDIPASNVLRFFLSDGSWFAVRPSGTEPKIKFYFYTCGDSCEEAKEKGAAIRQALMERISAVA